MEDIAERENITLFDLTPSKQDAIRVQNFELIDTFTPIVSARANLSAYAFGVELAQCMELSNCASSNHGDANQADSNHSEADDAKQNHEGAE